MSRGKKWARTSVLLVLTLLCACYSHSFPTADHFTMPTAPDCPTSGVENCVGVNTAQVFADANGTFYPSGWRAYLRPHSPWGAGSLLNETTGNNPTDPDFRHLIEGDQARQLNELANFGRQAGRIFILVHGYNNTVAEADVAYRLIERQLDLRPTDRIIRFYWDGLSGSGIGAGKIWFNAVGNGQLVGTRALRAILNQFNGKTIYIIGHSRGTSVILSALGNPIYDPRFIQQTRRIMERWPAYERDLFNPRPLLPNGNRLHILVLAPAVDRIDFCDSQMQPERPGPVHCGPSDLRPLGDQVASFRYSVNRQDPILRKFVGLQSSFNPTGLGTDENVGAALVGDGLPLQAYVLDPPVREHTFSWYVQQQVFRTMLSDAGIGLTAAGASNRP
jgi:hypothetical protein